MKKILLVLFITITIISIGLSNALACGCCGSQSNNSAEVKQAPEQLIVEKEVSGTVQQASDSQVAEEKVQCPVMKNWILPSEAADLAEYNGKTYYFCCGGCKEKFLAEPDKYIESQS